MKMSRILQFAAIGFLTTHTANAALISPDTATASSEFNSSYVAENTINGTGLPANFTAADAHADYTQGNHWTTDGSAPTDEEISWGFNAPQSFSAIVIWNHRSNVISANSGYEPVSFDLTIFDGSNNVLLFWDNASLLPDTATGQTLGFGQTISGISSVKFEVEQTQSSTSYTGLAEVAFDDTPVDAAVPVAPALPLLLTGLAALTALRARYKRSA